MLTPERALEYYFAIVIVVGGLSTLLGIKYTLRTWRSFPESKWLEKSIGTGFLILVLASFIEGPFLLLPIKTPLAVAAGLSEEILKLLPLKLFAWAEKWEKWKLVVGTAFFLGLIEAVGYIAGIILLAQPLYLVGVRLVLVGMHTVWAVVTVGFLLTEKGLSRFKGLAFSIIAHTLYDIPPLAITDGVSGNTVAYLAGLSTGFLLVTPLVVRKATEVVSALSPQQDEGALGTSTPEEKF